MSKTQTQHTPWSLRRDEHGFAVAIELDGRTVCHLHRGTVRNEAEGGAETVLRALNAHDALVAACKLMDEAGMIPAISSLPTTDTAVGRATRAIRAAIAQSKEQP